MIYEESYMEGIKSLEADICVVGAGPAGISLAIELMDTGLSVLLLESGGYEFSPVVQSMYQGEIIGQAYAPLEESRLRYFGGSSNHWNGKCAPLSPLELAGRRSWDGSAWPIEPQELIGPYIRAQELCQLSGFDVYSESLSALNKEAAKASDSAIGSLLGHRVFQRSPPTRFGEVYRATLMASKNIHVQLGATVTELKAVSSGEHIEEAMVSTLSGKHITVKAQKFVLATGGLENVRLLLNSNNTNPKGIGNNYDLVGRYFMEHLQIHDAAVAITHSHSSDWAIFNRWLEHKGVNIQVDLTLPDEVFFDSDFPVCDFQAGKFRRLDKSSRKSSRFILESLADFSMPANIGLHSQNIKKRLYEKFHDNQRGPYSFKIAVSMEQPPLVSSRVTLGDTLDRLGQRRIALDWHVPEQIYDDFRMILMELGRRMINGRLGTIQILIDSYDSFLQALKWQWHHMGTTRMSREPDAGVVDPDCRVHGVDNLFIAGSSVFPSGGVVNPTLTICALSVRLAHHIKAQKGNM